MAVAADGTMTGETNNPGELGNIEGMPQGQAAQGGVMGYARSPQGKRILLIIAAAATLALMAGIWLWSQKVEYRVLFANFNDRDGGAIVASLQQMNVPYKYSDGGTAILVPENMVHDARLKLASQGLPKGGNVGFELMENQKLGISQFLEQVNFQRALEGELARSVQSLASVQTARVHLALPKASVFVRDQQKPTASVILSLYPGRFLDQQQVSAIVHLVASSVPELSPKAVTIVDQNGNLLSDTTKQAQTNTLDPTQLKYVQDMQQDWEPMEVDNEPMDTDVVEALMVACRADEGAQSSIARCQEDILQLVAALGGNRRAYAREQRGALRAVLSEVYSPPRVTAAANARTEIDPRFCIGPHNGRL